MFTDKASASGTASSSQQSWDLLEGLCSEKFEDTADQKEKTEKADMKAPSTKKKKRASRPTEDLKNSSDEEDNPSSIIPKNLKYGVVQPPGSPSERVSLMHIYNQDLVKEGSVKLKFGQQKNVGSSGKPLTKDRDTKLLEGPGTDKITETSNGAKENKTAETPGAQRTDGANNDKITETPDAEKPSMILRDPDSPNTSPGASPSRSTTKEKRQMSSPDRSEPPTKKKREAKLKDAPSPASPR